MSFEVDRYSSAWGHIAHCADLTWAAEPPDDFILANQRLWTQHCRVSQILKDAASESKNSQGNSCELTEKQSNTSQNQENGCSSGTKSVKDVIPESRLAQHYGNFYYDEAREKYYTSTNEKSNARGGYSGQGCENCDLTECWMLPEVEYWFRKLLDEPADRSMRRRRQYRMLVDDDLNNGHRSAASERWGLPGAEDGEAALAARVMAVRGLWAPRAASPPPAQRKIRARRKQPRRLALAPPPPAYCIDVPAKLLCDPKCKFKFDSPRPPQLTEHQRAIGRLSASVQAVMRASAARCQPYRGTNVSRYQPTSQRPQRHGAWWPRDHPAARLQHLQLATTLTQHNKTKPEENNQDKAPKDNEEASSSEQKEEKQPEQTQKEESEKTDSIKTQEKVFVDTQQPSTSAAAAIDLGLKKRLYSTVLSMSAPAPINLASAVRLSQKLAPALLKLNPKMVLQSRGRPAVDHKFEQLEKEALEQYKASDESIDTKFRELEKQAVDQYSNSNSNTSCSSGNSAEKRASTSPPIPENDPKKKQPAKFHKEKSGTTSQNISDLNTNTKGQTSSVTNLKNFHTPPRGEKKEQAHRSKNTRSVKTETHRAASDTDETKGSHKVARWSSHVGPPKKRHLTLCVSDCSSDEELDESGGCLRDAGPCAKGKMKPSAHGGGDLCPILRKA